MTVFEALQNRHSVRAFTSQEVDMTILSSVLDHAKYTPSGVNTQPWQVAVVSGEMRQKLGTAMETAFVSGTPHEKDGEYYPSEWVQPYKGRRIACGLAMYSALEIARADKDKQKAQWVANYRSFDAPVVLYFFIDKVMGQGSLIDYGMFIQSVMLGLTSVGLASCPQAALAEYPDVVKSHLGYTDKTLICGMAVGYEDSSQAVNQYRTDRVDVEEFTQWFK